MIYLIAWRNIWRNRSRSLVVVAAMVLGICATVFIMGFTWGMYEYRINDLIYREVSHLQIHNPEFLENNETKYLIREDETLLRELENNPDVKSFSPRVLGMGMMMSSRGQTGAMVQGIDTTLEDNTTQLRSKLVQGTYFNGTRAKPILVSKRMLDELKLDLGQRLTLKVDHHPGVRYKITGVFETNNSMYDELNVFVLREHLREQLGMEEGYHEIAVLLHDEAHMEEFRQQLTAADKGRNLVRNWKELVPEVAVGLDSFNTSILVIVLIIFLGVAFGIVNTMLMAVLERVREIGMLLSIGMTRRRVFAMMMIETIFLSLVGMPIGLLLGYLLIETTGNTGIDLAGLAEGFSGMGFSSMVYPSLTLSYYIQIAVEVFIIVFIASLIPAFRARKLKPAEAIRKL